MSFLSLTFVLFVGATLLAFQIAPVRARPLVLLAASYVFYLSYAPTPALLLLGVTLAVHLTALAIERTRTDRVKLRMTGLAVAALVFLLAGFKWAGVLSAWLRSGQGNASGAALHLLVPLGLSYYLFKLIGYLLDVYWERVPAQRSFVSVALYASFFPQIVSGPIECAGDFFGQLERLGHPDPAAVTRGLRRIMFGVFKKLAIADRLAVLVETVHANPRAHSSLELLLVAYVFAIQLYADFSGVTDIAIGLGLLFGVKAPENFNLPFFSRNLQEFWRRWHASLTSWLTEYLFTPLRMVLRDQGTLGLALAIFVTMLVIGLWHGAALTYFAFGVVNGIFMVVSALTLKTRDVYFKRHPWLSKLRTFTGPLVTFHLWVLALVLFRANSLSAALEYFTHLAPGLGGAGIAAARLELGVPGLTSRSLAGALALVVPMEFVHVAMRRPLWVERFLAWPRPVRWSFYYATILVTLVVGHLGVQKFIYAQF
jgi:alginate O-acetyltransferase complex protein AlgI